MKIIDESHQIAEVAERWKSQYYSSSRGWSTLYKGEAEEIYKALQALDPSKATAKDVADIIGNRSWAGTSDCHECGATVECTVEVGQSPDYESHTVQLCEGCLRKAVALIAAHNGNER